MSQAQAPYSRPLAVRRRLHLSPCCRRCARFFCCFFCCSQVRETQDHGSFNSWDRQPFYYTNAAGKDTYVPSYREIRYNFWVNNYNPQEAVDNDDGSCW